MKFSLPHLSAILFALIGLIASIPSLIFCYNLHGVLGYIQNDDWEIEIITVFATVGIMILTIPLHILRAIGKCLSLRHVEWILTIVTCSIILWKSITILISSIPSAMVSIMHFNSGCSSCLSDTAFVNNFSIFFCAFLCLTVTSCVSSAVMNAAEGHPAEYVSVNGSSKLVASEKKPAPIYYTLMPLAIPADVILLPVTAWAFSRGLQWAEQGAAANPWPHRVTFLRPSLLSIHITPELGRLIGVAELGVRL